MAGIMECNIGDSIWERAKDDTYGQAIVSTDAY